VANAVVAPKPYSADHPAGQAPELRLLLICHAEGLQNRYGDLQHDGAPVADSGLTAFGWEQTTLLAQWLLTHDRIDILFSGPMLRSRLTAQRVGQTLGLMVNVAETLQGRFPPETPLPWQWTRQQRTFEQWDAPAAVDVQQAYGAYLRQLTAALDAIIAEQVGKTVAVVMSGNALATAVRAFFGAHRLAVAVNHTGITELRRQDGQWQLMYVNRREHLPVPAAAPTRPAPAVAGPLANGEHTSDLGKVTQVYNKIQPTLVEENDAAKSERLRHLLKFAGLPVTGAILDIGAGTGQLALALAESGEREVIGVDISPVMLESAEYLRLRSTAPGAGRVSFRLAPAHALPFRDERFDAVICRLLLHHSHRPQDILNEAARLLKHGGCLIIADLLSVDDPVKRATQNAIEEKRNASHVAAFSTEQYRKLVTAAGLSIEADKVVTFERELEEWLNDLQTEQAVRSVVREMVEAGLETDAAGLNARRRGDKIFFEQRLYYLKARKP
jgi:ubiquinone/menaquinone biosynthesis C-methylase UbiE/broad specificity phosphatase PhoE